MSMALYFLSFACVFVGALSGPAFNITPCKRSDNACITNIAKAFYALTIRGVPELGVEPLDPMFQGYIEGKLSVINYTLRNSTLEGFKDCEVNEAKFSPDLTNIHMDLRCPKFRMSGLYDIDGKFVVMPIQGNGDYWIEVKNYTIHIDLETKQSTGKDGKAYMSFKNFEYVAELKGGIDLDLRNLFNGRQDLAEPVLKFARENGQDVAEQLQRPILTANIKRLVTSFNKILKNVPLENAFLD